MKVIFMGTPEFAIPSLAILLNNGYDVVGLITSTDKFGGRNKTKLIESDIKKYAISRKLNVLQPKNLKSPIFIEELKSLNADIQIVVAFRMLPEIVWNMPKYGTINLHGSLLPNYRGAAPINWAIINGEKETGVTTFKLKHEIDTGNIIFQDALEIAINDTAGSIHDRLKFIGANLIFKTIKQIELDKVKYIEQDLKKGRKAPKIFNDDCKIDFEQDVLTVHNFIRGLSPFPSAWTILDNKKCKIIYSKIGTENSNLKPLEIETDQKNHIRIGTLNGYIDILELQIQGKRRMIVRDLLNGYKIQEFKVKENFE